jgi:hypothetical protein
MNARKHAPLLVSGCYFLFAAGLALSELYTRIFDRGNSELAGLVTYAITLPSSIVADRALLLAGMPIGGSDVAFVLFCALSVGVNSLLVYVLMRWIWWGASRF